MTAPDIPIRLDGLQLSERPGFQRRVWAMQRVMWGVFGLIIAAALAGLAGGSGPMARGQGMAGTVVVDAPRILRLGGMDEIILDLPPAASGMIAHHVTLGPSLVSHLRLGQVLPDPAQALTAPDGLHLTITAQGGGRVVLPVTAERAGMVSGPVRIDGAVLALRLLILP